MLLLHPYASLDQILTGNVTQSSHNMTWNTCGQKNLHMRQKTKIFDFSVIAMSQRATFFNISETLVTFFKMKI